MAANMVVWSEDRIAVLTVLHERGLSASQIANEMTANPIGAEHHFTRNAICGKTARLMLEPRLKPHLTLEQIEARRRVKHEKDMLRQRLWRRENPTVKAPRPVLVIAPFTGSLNIRFADLEPFRKYASNQCRFIAAEPPGPEYLACGNPTASGCSYCVHCQAITHYQPGIILTDAERTRARQTRFSPSIVPQAEAAE